MDFITILSAKLRLNTQGKLIQTPLTFGNTNSNGARLTANYC